MKQVYTEALFAFDQIVYSKTHLPVHHQQIFKSFWMGGYECSDQLNCYGHRVDLLHETRHLDRITQDYLQLRSFNIHTVREGIRWSAVEPRPYQYDFSAVCAMIQAAKETGIQQIWDICHFGFPDDLTPLHPQFTPRFVALCKAFIRFYRQEVPEGTVIITPINEVGFVSWLGGEVAGTSPYAIKMGWEVKYALTKAYIQGIKAIKDADAAALILVTEPLVSIIPPLDATIEQVDAAILQHEIQYQVMDMLIGRICPELGGQEGLIDIVGFNFYYNNQWIVGTEQFLPWANDEPDERWRSLTSLLIEAQQRYDLPMIIAETSHPEEDRPIWITTIAKSCQAAIDAGVNLLGICLYPIIDRPDWDDLSNWHRSGLWDGDASKPESRELYLPYAQALLRAQTFIKNRIHKCGCDAAVTNDEIT
jgi:beta-glucosidase/6-phospho-beta-glucosidase/beta-galactosidase